MLSDNDSERFTEPTASRPRTFSRVSRARRSAVVFATLGSGLAGPLSSGLYYRLTGRRDRAGTWMEALPATLERLGPAFVKFAQIVGTRQDVLPPRLCASLSRLHDAVAPMTKDDAIEVLEAEYGPQWSDHLLDFDFTPIGSGTIACVYKARLIDGTEVAVKLRRPGIEPGMERDVDLIQTVMEITGRLPGMKGVPVADMGRAVGASVLAQVDFTQEAANLAALKENLAPLNFVTVPEPLPLSRPSALVMTYHPASRGDVAAAQVPTGEHRKELGRQTMLAVFDMLFRTGLVHCDLHPGNLRIVDGGERMVILDAGLVYRIPDRVRQLLALFFLNMGVRNGVACANAVLESAADVPPGSDLDGFRAEMDSLVDRYGQLPSQEFNLIDFAGDLFAVQRRHGLYASSQFVFPLLALLMVEGSVRTLNPELNFQALARPVVMKAAYTAEEQEAL
jgi:ubiquinone biosynthesis protein